MFLCIPIICGPQSSLKQESDETYVCPNCRNASVKAYKRKKWFELYWIPLVPLGSKHVFVCPVCRWQHLNDESIKLQQVGAAPSHAGQGTVQAGRGYDVGYANQPQGGQAAPSSYPPATATGGKPH